MSLNCNSSIIGGAQYNKSCGKQKKWRYSRSKKSIKTETIKKWFLAIWFIFEDKIHSEKLALVTLTEKAKLKFMCFSSRWKAMLLHIVII